MNPANPANLWNTDCLKHQTPPRIRVPDNVVKLDCITRWAWTTAKRRERLWLKGFRQPRPRRASLIRCEVASNLSLSIFRDKYRMAATRIPKALKRTFCMHPGWPTESAPGSRGGRLDKGEWVPLWRDCQRKVTERFPKSNTKLNCKTKAFPKIWQTTFLWDLWPDRFAWKSNWKP